MFRVETQIELLAGSGRYASSPEIRLRGYLEEEPIIAPAQFKDTPAVSVGSAVGFCPTLRDLYLLKRLRVKVPGEKPANHPWRRVVGKLIEGALEHAYDHYAANPVASGSSVDEIAKAAQDRLAEYVKRKRKEFAGLDARIEGRFDLPSSALQQLLTDSIVLDLFFHQGALNYGRLPSADSMAVNALKLFPEWTPPHYIKLGKATPDFTIMKHRAIGDVKMGPWSDEYFITAAGYALAYESYYKENVDLGVIYLVDADPMFLNQGRLLIFLLTDEIRQRFLDRRNDALRALTPSAPVPSRLNTALHVEQYCEKCSCKAECFARDDFGGAANDGEQAGLVGVTPDAASGGSP